MLGLLDPCWNFVEINLEKKNSADNQKYEKKYATMLGNLSYLGDTCIQKFHLGRYIYFEYGYPHSNALLQFPLK